MDKNQLGLKSSGTSKRKSVKKKFIKENDSTENTNEFPYHIFPKQIQEIILETNKHLCFPIDFIGASILFAISVAIGNTHKVEVMKGWIDSAVLYLAIVARAGTNKSHPLSFAIEPLLKQDIKTYRQYQKLKIEYDRVSKFTKKEIKEEGLSEPICPFWEKTLVTDFTPEALAQILKTSKKGVGVYSDELAGWFKNFNRYHSGSEMEFWLSVWNSKPINIDRKTGEPILIPFPFVSVGGTIQNGLLEQLAKGGRTQNGFIERILFVIPDNIQKPYWSETEISPDIIKNWEEIVSKFLKMPLKIDENHVIEPNVLRFSSKAKKIIYKWQRTNADQCNAIENEAISGILSKLEMYVPRFALILQIMRWSCNKGGKEEIGLKAMQGALVLVEYFKNSAIKVSSIISNKTPVDSLPLNKQILYKALPPTFKTGNAVKIAHKFRIPERTFKNFLSKTLFFECIKRGHYKKCF